VADTHGAEVATALARPTLSARAFALSERDAVARLLAGAGFAKIEIDAFDASVWVGDDVDDALEFFFETDGRPLDDRLDQKGIERLTAALRRELSAHERSDGVWLASSAWLVTAHSSA
jgi:hypothetical protein